MWGVETSAVNLRRGSDGVGRGREKRKTHVRPSLCSNSAGDEGLNKNTADVCYGKTGRLYSCLKGTGTADKCTTDVRALDSTRGRGEPREATSRPTG